jgi:hypothetical protein
MTTKQCDEQIAALKQKIHAWQHEKQLKQQHADALMKKRDSLRSASLRNNDPKATAALQDARAAMSVAMLELDDLGAEISAASTEVDELLVTREAVARDESWTKFLAESKKATAEGAQIERYLQNFISLMQPHRDRLTRITQLAKAAGLEKNFDDRHLQRRFAALMRKIDPWGGWNRQHEQYDQAYDKILGGIFDAADAQRQPCAPEQRALNQ